MTKFIFRDYATQNIKKLVKIAFDYYQKTGCKKVKINKTFFDFSKEEKSDFFALSQNTFYRFYIEE